MRKIFTLAAVASMACVANAQSVESWSVANSDGTLKAEYVANTVNPNEASRVEFFTPNVKGVHVSGPIAGYNDGETVPLEPKVDNGWGGIKKKDLSSDGSVAPFYYVQGKGNPVNIDKVTFEEIMTDGSPTGMYRAKWDDSYYSPDGSAGLPSNGTYVMLTPGASGMLKVGVWINKGSRDVYVVKSTDNKALALGTDVAVSGYINGQNNDVADESPLKGYPAYQEAIATKGTEGSDAYVIGMGNQPVWAYLTFKVEPGEDYYVFNKNTQIGFAGYEFTAGESGIADIIADDSVNPDAPIYNVYGQRVNKDYKGILIQNGKKFVNR